MWRGLANGHWVDPRRIRVVCGLLLVATLVSGAALLLTSSGTLDRFGRPIGTDFSNVYAAGWMANHGHAAAAWIWPEHYRIQQMVHHSATVPFYGWHYPPPFLLIASLLASLPYLAALAVWQGVGLAGAVQVARTVLPGRGTILAALAAPATFVCLGHGQNAFLTASLLGGGLILLERRPWLAGMLLGCLVYKPQFAVLLPVVLVAAGSRRAFLGAAFSSLALSGLTLAIWGPPVWHGFFDSLTLTRTIVLESGETGWEKIVSAFSAVRALGASVPFAMAVQSLVTGLAVAGAAAAARWGNPATRGAAICCAAVLSTPYALDYDLVILAMALVFMTADAQVRGWLNWEKSLIALAYLSPLFGRQVAGHTLIPLNLLATAAIFALALRRMWLLDLRGRFQWRATTQAGLSGTA